MLFCAAGKNYTTAIFNIFLKKVFALKQKSDVTPRTHDIKKQLIIIIDILSSLKLTWARKRCNVIKLKGNYYDNINNLTRKVLPSYVLFMFLTLCVVNMDYENQFLLAL